MFPERVVSRVLTRWTPDGECWISTYSTGSHGYAQVGWTEGSRTTMTTAHRVAWWAANRRPIEQGMTVDHICHTKRCVNPAHLRLLSNTDNAVDNGWRKTNQPSDKLCKYGHRKYTYSSGPRAGMAYCPTCNNARARKRRREQREATF